MIPGEGKIEKGGIWVSVVSTPWQVYETLNKF